MSLCELLCLLAVLVFSASVGVASAAVVHRAEACDRAFFRGVAAGRRLERAELKMGGES